MDFVPSELIMPGSYEQTSSPFIRKPVFGTIDQQFVRFYMDHVYNDAKSKALQYEVMEPCEMCEIVNDRFTTVRRKVKDLSQRQKGQFAKLYEAFQQQKEFGGTLIEKWSAINESERALLIHCKVMTVEVLAELTQTQRQVLGPYADELVAKAKRHVEAKAEKVKSEAYAEELNTMRKEIERVREESKTREEELYKRLAAQEEKKKGGRPRKQQTEEISSDELQTA